jgi:hypothetical protein
MRTTTPRRFGVAAVIALVLACMANMAQPAQAQEAAAASNRQVALFEVPSGLHLASWKIAKPPKAAATEAQLLYFSGGADLVSGSFNDDDLRVGVLVSLAPIKKTRKDSFVVQLRKKQTVVKTTINGAPAAAMVAPTQVVIWWVSNNHQVVLAQMGKGTSLAAARNIAQTVRVNTTLSPPVRMQTPPTTTLRVNQALSSISAPHASAVYQSASHDDMIGVSMSQTTVAVFEAALTVTPTIVSTISGGIQSKQLRIAPTVISVHGQPGFHTDLLDEDDRKQLVWFSPGGESFELGVRNDSPISLMDAAERVASVDSDRWAEIQSESEVQQGDAPAPAGELAAAGTTANVPWTGQRLVLADKVCVRVSVATTVNRFCAGGTTTRWTSIRTTNGFAAVGMTRPDVRTVVLQNAQGLEIARAEISQIAPSLSSFVVPASASLKGATIVGLDVNGTPVDGPVPVGA